MPTEWKARLDGRGYHATSVKRVSMAARWDGAPRAPQKTALLRATPSSRNPDDPDDQSKQLLVAKGDAFYLSGARRGQPAEAHPRSRRSIPSWPPALTSTTPRSRHSPTRGRATFCWRASTAWRTPWSLRASTTWRTPWRPSSWRQLPRSWRRRPNQRLQRCVLGVVRAALGSA